MLMMVDAAVSAAERLRRREIRSGTECSNPGENTCIH